MSYKETIAEIDKNIQKSRLENILLKMANEVLDLPKSNQPIGTPIDDAVVAILDLFEKENK